MTRLLLEDSLLELQAERAQCNDTDDSDAALQRIDRLDRQIKRLRDELWELDVDHDLRCNARGLNYSER